MSIRIARFAIASAPFLSVLVAPSIGHAQTIKATGPCGYLSTSQFTKPKKGKGPWDIHIQRSATFSATAQQLVCEDRSAALLSPGEFAGILAKP